MVEDRRRRKEGRVEEEKGEAPGNLLVWEVLHASSASVRADSRSAGFVLQKEVKARVRPSSPACTGASCPPRSRNVPCNCWDMEHGISVSTNRNFQLR